MGADEVGQGFQNILHMNVSQVIVTKKLVSVSLTVNKRADLFVGTVSRMARVRHNRTICQLFYIDIVRKGQKVEEIRILNRCDLTPPPQRFL